MRFENRSNHWKHFVQLEQVGAGSIWIQRDGQHDLLDSMEAMKVSELFQKRFGRSSDDNSNLSDFADFQIGLRMKRGEANSPDSADPHRSAPTHRP